MNPEFNSIAVVALCVGFFIVGYLLNGITKKKPKKQQAKKPDLPNCKCADVSNCDTPCIAKYNFNLKHGIYGESRTNDA